MNGRPLEEMEGVEKRQFHRFRHTEPVEFQFKDPSQYGGCLSGDLSGGGIRVRSNEFIPLNTELMLQIKLADERIVPCTGRVVWIRKARFGDYYQVGLEFIGGQSAVHVRNVVSGFFQSQGSVSGIERSL